MQYGCIGEKLSHSFSKEIHALIGDYSYEIKEIAREELQAFMTCADFLGINVTIPYKEEVIPYLDFIDDSARTIGAVNTIVKREGKLFGYNTDFYGMLLLIRRMGVSADGKKAAILGTGGTAKTARAVLTHLGAGEIITVGRREKEGVISYTELYEKHSDTDIIVNTTPCGMYPYADGSEERAASAVDISRFPSLAAVLDAVYNPLSTDLVLSGREREIPSEGGLYMLVAQAVRASEMFFNTEYDRETCERLYKKILDGKQNTVLIGMPTSGKSTVGRILSEMTGKPFIDTDDVVREKIGMEITDFFRKNGESAFRDVESEAVREVSALGGYIIATGGGVILRDENVMRLRRNGKLFFLDRPLSKLIPSGDRPLAFDVDAIKRRYEERYDRYLSSADIRIDIKEDPEGVARRIIKENALR